MRDRLPETHRIKTAEPFDRPILVLTVGLPRSGKSTWARSQGHPIVCPDAIRLSVHGQPFFADAEPLIWAIAKTMMRSLFHAGHDTVILDGTNLQRQYRDQWISSMWQRDFQIFTASKEICIERAVQTEQEYLIEVIERMAASIDPVADEERSQ